MFFQLRYEFKFIVDGTWTTSDEIEQTKCANRPTVGDALYFPLYLWDTTKNSPSRGRLHYTMVTQFESFGYKMLWIVSVFSNRLSVSTKPLSSNNSNNVNSHEEGRPKTVSS